MAPPAEAWSSRAFGGLPGAAQTAVLIVLAGLVLFLAFALDAGGDTAFMYATF